LKPLLYAKSARVQSLNHKVKPIWLWAACKAACRGLFKREGNLLACRSNSKCMVPSTWWTRESSWPSSSDTDSESSLDWILILRWS
jgi:hypothetical protein